MPGSWEQSCVLAQGVNLQLATHRTFLVASRTRRHTWLWCATPEEERTGVVLCSSQHTENCLLHS